MGEGDKNEVEGVEDLDSGVVLNLILYNDLDNVLPFESFPLENDTCL